MAVIDLKKTTLKIQDGGSNELEVKIGEGNLVYTERREMEYLRDKGALDTVREGDEQPIEVRMDFQWEYLLGSSSVTVEDALKQRGDAAGWATTSADACEPYCVDLEVHYDPECGAGNIETTTLSEYRYETLEHDLRSGQVSSTGQCNTTQATHVRS